MQCTLHSLIRLVPTSIFLKKESLFVQVKKTIYTTYRQDAVHYLSSQPYHPGRLGQRPRSLGRTPCAPEHYTFSGNDPLYLAQYHVHRSPSQPVQQLTHFPYSHSQNIRIPANGCGEGVKVDGAAVEATFKAGTTGKLTWNLNNGDGGGPLVVAFDTTGKGTSFNTKAVVTKNVEGVNGGVSRAVPRGDKPVEFTVPNVKCERCVLQIRQDLAGGKDGFGSCAIVSIV